MNDYWQEFLVARGAVLDSNGYLSFQTTNTDPFDTHQDYCCDCSHLGVIRVSGDDAFDFLHGQFTNDLNLVNKETSQLSSYCNPKGRMLAIFRIIKKEDDYFLLMRRDVIEVVLKKLTMFKLMAKVELIDVSDELVVFGVSGANSVALLNKNNIHEPEKPEQVTTQQNITAINLAGENPRTLIISPPEDAIKIWQALTETCEQTSFKTWELIDIQNGIPQVTAETSEAFIPQMVNLELIGGVNFQKGCYPGQEIVARTHYLGKPNRRMYRINIDSEVCPKAGTNIFSKADGEQAVGKIVNAQNNGSNSCDALAVLRTEKEESNDMHLENQEDTQIKIVALPYSLNPTT